ncbi:hypothetical protein SERLADRAFT_479085 [Serpula lacrymans var. lacrymans S7.9]|uniref:PHD-type domain-containing protein n=1 Tax=Serpula lacrymans var. lacrymans (strain S7.9) TaxID=578457 RepID=F8PBA0_SERL9|nr:uncharacterized protein SERLADRAFT_479085 [Serpula lacrymans var. lacrymans S7.9]EGO19540.1 hypothetical protein SERLADRAFT_479085 [Serpula lacrymans var. lacrymans S7.9]
MHSQDNIATFSSPVEKSRSVPSMQSETSSTPRSNRDTSVFLSLPYSHLPTPQSPNSMGSYVHTIPRLQFAMSHEMQPEHLKLLDPAILQHHDGSFIPRASVFTRQVVTPDSSPLLARTKGHSALLNRSSDSPSLNSEDTPSHQAISDGGYTVDPPSKMIVQPSFNPQSALSSTSNLTTSEGASQPIYDTVPQSFSLDHVHDVFTAPIPSNSRESVSSINVEVKDNVILAPVTEMRRPDYFKRAKRATPDTGFDEIEDVDLEERGHALPGIGVTVSPNRGRRLKLFQETSDESFEQSLMFGSFDRFRPTEEWPHPSFSETGEAHQDATNGASLELSEKELKKRSRLAAFLASTQTCGPSRLRPVDVEGRGRVLLDTSIANFQESTSPSSSRRKGTRRRKKNATSASVPNAMDMNIDGDHSTDAPNWPDSEFPWRLRAEQRTNLTEAEQEERLHWIGKFLDRDSDDDDVEDDAFGFHRSENPDKVLGDGEHGRLLLPQRTGKSLQTALLSGDPADARIALLSKRSLRSLAYKKPRRNGRNADMNEDGIDCVCNGRNDGEELVQCDQCHTWYHLQCIGIRNVKELGREEDPWFCPPCVEVMGLPSPREPTFVPTDEKLTHNPAYDPPFFQGSFQMSPATPWGPSRPPKTPPRNNNATAGFSSGSSWDEPSKQGPVTPQFPSQSARVYTTPGPFDNIKLDESPYDPTSTPSRGINFGPPFSTPKTGLWSARAPRKRAASIADERQRWQRTFIDAVSFYSRR